MAFKNPPKGLRPWMVEINVEYDFIVNSLANPAASCEGCAR